MKPFSSSWVPRFKPCLCFSTSISSNNMILAPLIMLRALEVSKRTSTLLFWKLPKEDACSIMLQIQVDSQKRKQDITLNNFSMVLDFATERALLTEISSQRMFWLITNWIWKSLILDSQLQQLGEITAEIWRHVLVLLNTWHLKFIKRNHIKVNPSTCSPVPLFCSFWLPSIHHLQQQMLQKIPTTSVLLKIDQICSGKPVAKISQESLNSSLRNLRTSSSRCCRMNLNIGHHFQRCWAIHGWRVKFLLKKR